MLSHCTIIASVDAEQSAAPLGRSMHDGFQIERKYADWLITPETSKYVNNNNDAWERKLLLACFRTFIGGENYVEHIQIPEMSKGKIIDAAARDIGDSIYVDILVATQKRHNSLIRAITSGDLQTLSMGCFLPGTPVTMADGTRLPIEEVAVGDMVLTHKGRSREVHNKQLHHGIWDMRRIEVVGVPDPIEATDKHPFYVLRPAKVCACGCGETLVVKDADPVRRMSKRFKRGHDKRVLNPNGSYSLEEARKRQGKLDDIQSLKVEKVRADELSVGDYVIFPKLDVEVLDDPGTAKARLLGYFLAEGCFEKYKGEPVRVIFSFAHAEKDSFVSEVLTLLRQEFPGCEPYTQDLPERDTCNVKVAGRDIAAWFNKHGGEYSHLKRLSPEVMQWSVESHKHLLGAWINGDGQRNVSGHSLGTTTSYALATQLHLLSIRCGLPVRMDCIFGGKTALISEAVVGGVSLRHEETGKLAAFNLYFPQSSSCDLLEVTTKAPREGSRKKERHLRALDDMVIFPITKIEEFAYEGWVHNMEVDEDHSYQVSGLAASNCQVEFTICTKCGNTAYDETQLCNHIRYFKGNDFVDELGKKRKIAELCGHINEEPGSVKFIEASWVANPAFTGAVLRNVLSPMELAEIQQVGEKMMIAFSQPARVPSPDSWVRAASLAAQDQGQSQSPSQGQGEDKPAPKKDDNPLDKAVSEMSDLIREKAIAKARAEMGTSENDSLPDENLSNESLIKSALKHPSWRRLASFVLTQTRRDPVVAKKMILGMVLYRHGGWKAVESSKQFSGREILGLSRLLDLATKRRTMAGETRIYRTVLALGGLGKDQDVRNYLSNCRQVAGRDLTDSERQALLLKGRLFAMGS